MMIVRTSDGLTDLHRARATAFATAAAPEALFIY